MRREIETFLIITVLFCLFSLEVRGENQTPIQNSNSTQDHATPTAPQGASESRPIRPATPAAKASTKTDNGSFVLMIGGGDAGASERNLYFDCKVETEMDGSGKHAEEDLVMVIPKFGWYADNIPAKDLDEKGFYLNISSQFPNNDADSKKIEFSIGQYPSEKPGKNSRAIANKKLTVGSDKEFSLTFPGVSPLKLVTLNCKPAEAKEASNKKNAIELQASLDRANKYLKDIDQSEATYGPAIRAGLYRFAKNVVRLEPESARKKYLDQLDTLIDSIRNSPKGTKFVDADFAKALKSHDFVGVDVLDLISRAKDSVEGLKSKPAISKQDITLPERNLQEAKKLLAKMKTQETAESLENKIKTYTDALEEARSKVNFDKLPDYPVYSFNTPAKKETERPLPTGFRKTGPNTYRLTDGVGQEWETNDPWAFNKAPSVANLRFIHRDPVTGKEVAWTYVGASSPNGGDISYYFGPRGMPGQSGVAWHADGSIATVPNFGLYFR